MNRDAPVKLRIPRQDLEEFDTFQLSEQAAREWAERLPVANSREVALQLHPALERLNRVDMAPELRFGILEALRPGLLVATASLSKRFLKQPLVMPDEPRQMAELTDSLYARAATAYTLAAVHAIQRRDRVRDMNPARLACESILRAVRFCGARLLQTFQLYRPVELHGWLDLHQLYALAEGQQLAAIKVGDRLGGDGTVSAAYLQALLLGCSKPNKLRQADLAAIYRGLRDWSAMLQVKRERDGESLFLVDLDSDHPPLYSALYRDAPGPRTRYIDTQPLIDHLRQLATTNDRQGVVFDKDTAVSPALMQHLVEALGKMSMRNFTRKRSSRSLQITVGLSACHYHLAGERQFEDLLHAADYVAPAIERLPDNPFLTRHEGRDLWQRANPEEDFENSDDPLDRSDLAHRVEVDDKTRALLEGTDQEEPPARQAYPVYEAAIFDSSPGGYCLEWTAELPANIRTGDLACVREHDEASWAVAAIRWVSQLANQRTLIGLELMSPGAEPYGALLQPRRGEEQSEPLRVLLLPEIKLVGQAQTLVTPRAGFREHQKITLVREGECSHVQLLRQLAVTSSFVRFEFRRTRALGEVLAEDKTRPRDSGFDSLWTNI